MPESQALEHRLLEEIMRAPAIDVHSHVPAAEPFARSLRELLGYHYYTELAHSAGMQRRAVAPERPDEEVVPALVEALASIDNTVQHGWLIELARELFGFSEDALTPENWSSLADAVARATGRPGRAGEVLRAARIEKVFLTNSFDEDLDGIDPELFVPSLRADALVFGLGDPAVREALERATGVAVGNRDGLVEALGAVVERFCTAGARSAAISLPPHFRAFEVPDRGFEGALGRLLGGSELRGAEVDALQSGVLFALTGLCRDCSLPLQVMCGALRDAYEHGVPQGTDLPQAGDTLRGLLPLLNAFPEVTFCLSVLSQSQAQELCSYGWILPNVVLSGHWWYANVPAYIEGDLAARLQSVPKTKLIGYYSDMYKVEFGLAKFNMYRRVLARVLAADFVEPGLGSEQDALAVARLLLRENAVRIFNL
ncbi:MAG: glucuronate isomerase [Planctomycetota bacterium]|jgi:glucuronate isomerase